MATIAEMLGDKAQDVRKVGAALPDYRRDALLVVAAGKPGSPYTRDRNGRLRKHGKFTAVPEVPLQKMSPEQRMLRAIFADWTSR